MAMLKRKIPHEDGGFPLLDIVQREMLSCIMLSLERLPLGNLGHCENGALDQETLQRLLCGFDCEIICERCK